ncbi:hypothetical protein M426DRAFT_321026 [Hypoxylon sp. CI-4A]|nr:hypothetical protein M426DRAFT_321026 [Hypoxylon sp. CI-4A]
MTDRQLTESSVGLAGRLSHVPYGVCKAEDCGWQSTRILAQNAPVFRELGPHNIWFPAKGTTDEQGPAPSTSQPWRKYQKQRRWLLKAHPEARLGNDFIHAEILASLSSPPHFQGHESWNPSLFAVGELLDTSVPKKIVSAPLIATTTGEANNVLRLTRPNVERWQWTDDESTSLQLLGVTEDAESAFVHEDIAAGSIRRLKSVVDPKRYDPTRWIIEQRDSGTRVFQPEYRVTPTITTYNSSEKPSRIATNPLLSISKDRTGGNPHADVSFNPGIRSKPPQLGLIDECGYWSIWNVAHTKVSSGKPKVTLNKCGHIETGVMKYLPSRGTGNARWHKIFWVGCPGSSPEEPQSFDLEEDIHADEAQGSFPQRMRSSTLLLCNRSSVKLLDLTNNSLLANLPFIGEKSRDCILDVHENPEDTQYFFVLTTSKLFVVRVYSASSSTGETWGETRKQCAVVLAVSHLRDNFDRSLKLTVVPGARSSKQGISLVHVYSKVNTQIDLFTVTMSKSNPFAVSYHKENIVLDVLHGASPGKTLQTMCFYPAPVHSSNGTTRQQMRYYQFVILRADMCLMSTLCVSASTWSPSLTHRPVHIAGKKKKPTKERKKMLRHLAERFMVPDYIALHGSDSRHGKASAKSITRPSVIRRPIRILYEHLGGVFDDQIQEYHEFSGGDGSFDVSPFGEINLAIGEAIDREALPATTLLEMIENLRVPHDMNGTSTKWQLEIEQIQDIDPNISLLALHRPNNLITKPTTSLYELYSMLLDLMAGINSDSNPQRWIQEARSTVLRRVAYEIYLSLFGLIHRRVDAPRQVDLGEGSQQSLEHQLDRMVIDSQRTSRAGSAAVSQSEMSFPALPTIQESTPNPENSNEEDPAMALLRSYTGTGKYLPTKRTELLDKWEVGANPDKYMFDLDRNKEVTPGMVKRAKQLARQSRKRRRAETLLQSEPTLPATQPAQKSHFFSSQVSQPFGFSSSQAIMSDPIHTMTQPTGGPFGHREERPRKKVKRRKGGF